MIILTRFAPDIYRHPGHYASEYSELCRRNNSAEVGAGVVVIGREEKVRCLL